MEEEMSKALIVLVLLAGLLIILAVILLPRLRGLIG